MKDNQNNAIGGMNILIADDVHELLLLGLRDAGFHVLYLPDATRVEILNRIAAMHILVIRTKTRVDSEVMDAAKKLLCIARAGAGLDNIDELYALSKNITCLNAGEANSDAVGEHTIGMLLSLLNNLIKANNEVKQRIWQREANRGIELAGKTVGILGFGNTGRAVAKKLKGFDVKVLAYDKYLVDYSTDFAEQVSLQQIFNETDILSVHLPLTNETTWLIDEDFVSRFKKSIYLLNLSRGKVIKTADLVQMIKSGKVLGCALDVLENENLSTLNASQENDFSFLIASKNVVLSPHIGGWTVESYRKISQILLDKLLTFRGSN